VVGRALAAGDLAAARLGLRSLVSRDTSALDPPLLAAAAVESVAENASDSLVAPLFYFVLGGVPAALAYRACNTLDALIGYHGETEWLGKAAARLDDLANLVPARLTAALLVVASALVGASAAGALRTWWRDGARTESPNAGRPMAAMAGALGVQLTKVGHYRLGDGAGALGAAAIARAVVLLYVACALASVGAAAALVVRHAA
jgi:adenosylcobinamide-phosphate synthase